MGVMYSHYYSHAGGNPEIIVCKREPAPDFRILSSLEMTGINCVCEIVLSGEGICRIPLSLNERVRACQRLFASLRFTKASSSP